MKTQTKTKFLALAVTGSLLMLGSGVALAQSSHTYPDAGGFIGIQTGNAHWSAPGSLSSANRLGYGINAGQRWQVTPNQTLGWQIDAQSFGRPVFAVSSPTSPTGSLPVKSKLQTYGIGANWRLHPNQGPWFVGATAGLEHGTAHRALGDLGSASNSANGYQLAANVGYSLTSNLDVSLGYQYDRFHFNGLDNHLDLGVTAVQTAWHF